MCYIAFPMAVEPSAVQERFFPGLETSQVAIVSIFPTRRRRVRRDSGQAASSVYVTVTSCASPVWRIRLCQLHDVLLAVSSLASRKCGHCPGRFGGGEILVGLELSRLVSVGVPVPCPRLASPLVSVRSSSIDLGVPSFLPWRFGSHPWIRTVRASSLWASGPFPSLLFDRCLWFPLFLSVLSREATSRLYLGCSGGSLALSSVTSIVLLD